MLPNPPKWADSFLRWYCNPELLEEIQGDTYELYDRRVETQGKISADSRFIWDVLRFCRWSNIKRTKTQYRSNSITMFSNYLKIGMRVMTKHWSISLINIVGLSLAIGWAITSFIFVDMMSNLDNYHSNKDNIYQIINYVKNDDGTRKWGDSPIALGPALKENHSQVKDAFRMEFRYGDVKFDKKVFHEFIVFADPGYFKETDFPFLSGSKNALGTRDQLVISYNTAKKYFADEDPIGKQIFIKFDEERQKSFLVAAVLDEYPYNTTIGYDFFLPMDNFYDLAFEEKLDWGFFSDATFVVLEDGSDPKVLTGQLDRYIETQNSQNPDWKIDSFELISLNDLPQQGYSIEGSVAGGNNPAGKIALSVIATMLVLMACFNFMNISVVAATRRMKEIGLRKVVGSQRKQIIWQFLTENYLQVFFSLILGTALSFLVFIPMFNMMIPVTIPFQFSSVPTMIGFFTGLLLLVGLTSGAYPAFYISRFQPVAIFRGAQRFSKNWLSQVLTAFQLFIAFITVVGCFIFADNAMYMGQQEWGYDAEGMLAVQVSNRQQFQAMRDFADKNAQVSEFAGTGNHIGHSAPQVAARQLEKDIRTHLFKVGSNYPKFMGLELIEGSFFNESIEAANNKELIVNAKFVEKMEWTSGLNQRVIIDSTEFRVVGVSTDFEFENYFGYTEMMPVALKVVDEDAFTYSVLKTAPDNMQNLEAEVELAWLDSAPNDPLNMWVQANIFDDFYKENKANIVIILFISGLAVVLACLGLFGLLSFNIQRRLKEFSVRKVLGAGAGSIVKAVSKQYAWLLGLSFAIAAPLGMYLMTMMINNIYPEPKGTTPWPFVMSVLVMVITISLTVSGQVYRATHVNPAENLRNE